MKYVQPYGVTDENASYVDGNPALGIEGSAVPAAAIEHPQRELVYLLTKAGITPDKAKLTQVYDAVQKLILDAAAAMASDAETIAGTVTTKAVTPKSLSARTATEARTGLVELATAAETATGTDSTRAVHPAGLKATLAKYAPLPQTASGVGQWVELGPYTGSTFTLPSGGTWAYLVMNGGYVSGSSFTNCATGVAAGGSSVSNPAQSPGARGFAWRIA